jgi:hypothetical protein
LGLLTAFQLTAQKSDSRSLQLRLEVFPPTAEAEADYVWRTLHDLPFFNQNNYQISLPSGDLMEELKTKAINGTLSDQDRPAFDAFFKNRVFEAADYESGLQKVQATFPLLNQMIEQIHRTKFNWAFKEFPVYEVQLTLYGPGGSYNPDEGTILIYTTPQGGFKQYKNPVNTIIHEIVHIGLEKSIVQVYQPPHPLKERVVDLFVKRSFGKWLPDYQIQDMGETQIDALLKKKKSLKKLDEHLAQRMKL